MRQVDCLAPDIKSQYCSRSALISPGRIPSMGRMIAAALFAAWLAATACTPALAWDYPGHRIVGAIADAVLSANEPDIYKKIVGTQSFAGILTVRDADGRLLQR